MNDIQGANWGQSCTLLLGDVWCVSKTSSQCFIYLITFSFGCSGSRFLAGFCLIAESRGCSLAVIASFSLRWLLWLQSMGSEHTGFSCRSTGAQQFAACGLQCTGSRSGDAVCCSTPCGIIPEDHGLNLSPLNGQVDSHPLFHQESPQQDV